jgi:hypothetical protein
MTNAYNISVTKPGRPKRNLENIQWALMTGCGNVDWIHVVHNRIQWHALANMVIYLRVLKKERNCLSTEAAISKSRIFVPEVCC